MTTNLACAAIAVAVLTARFVTPANVRIALEAIRAAFPAC